MKYSILVMFTAILVSGCQGESTTPEDETNVQNEVETEEINQEVETETEIQQTNVVTPEFWESYDTDVVMIFFYSKKESSNSDINTIKEEILNGESDLGYQFHEYHTDENMGMVQVDDNVFFNLTEYLWNNEEGFVLLKKGALLHIPASEVNEETYSAAIKPFFE